MKKLNVKLYSANNFTLFGKYDEETRTVKGIDAAVLDEATFVDYFKRKQVGETVTGIISANSDVHITELDARQTVTFNAVKAEFKAAKGMAGDELVNIVFDKFREKK